MAERWDRAEDLFIRKLLKEGRSADDVFARMWKVGYERTIEEVAERCALLKAKPVRRPSAVSLRKDSDPPIDARTQDRDFIDAMRHAIREGDECAIEHTVRDRTPGAFTHISADPRGAIYGSPSALASDTGCVGAGIATVAGLTFK